jgi:hypothetical protein
MSQSALTAEPRVAWPSNGISEVPFRLYTDPAQYAHEQERLFKGPTWNYLCLAVELAKPGDYIATTIGETAVIVVRDAGVINAFVAAAPSRQPAVHRARRTTGILPITADLRPCRPAHRRRVRRRERQAVCAGIARMSTACSARCRNSVGYTFSDAAPDLRLSGPTRAACCAS